MAQGFKKSLPRGKGQPSLPKIFRRGRKGIYYFRKLVCGKDKWISLETDDLPQAKQRLISIVKSCSSVEGLSKVESSAHKLAEVFVEGITGKKAQAIPLSEAYSKWISLTPGYGDISIATRKFYKSVFRRFVEWASAEKLDDCSQVTREHALVYSKLLWDSGICGKTYNDHLKILSRVFSVIDASTPLPNRDPFDRRRVPRKRKAEMETMSHEALEPDQMEKVLNEAACHGHDWRDLFLLGAHTGIRLKDASLLKWESIGETFIEITPCKTSKSGGKARIPISPVLAEMLRERTSKEITSCYVIPGIAEHYLKNSDFVTKKSKSIFDAALGAKLTRIKPGKHRMRAASIFSFHSFRTTFMSMLARQNVSARDAMRMLGWESAEMIRVYERELERARGDADTRALKVINAMDELKMRIPNVKDTQKALRPTPEQLKSFVEEYSNLSIGKIFGVSNVAVKKWMEKFGIVREKRVQSDLSDDEAAKLRTPLSSTLLNENHAK